jgi:MFS transporter, ACS family, glucarate transporter
MASDLPPLKDMPDSGPRPTMVRYAVLSFLGLLAFVLYIDRICIGQAAGPIEKELQLSEKQMGLVFAAFTVAYGLFEIPTGSWGDRYGSRGVLTRIVLWWSVFTALTGAAFGLISLIVVRFLFGAGEAGAYPNAARVIARWFPRGGRGPAQGLINTAALIGGAAAPVLTAYMIHLVGWRWAFVYFAVLGVFWAVAFYSWFHDDPNEHPAVNEAERRLIRAGQDPKPPQELHGGVPWRRVAASKEIWLLGGVISCAAFSTYLYFFWYSRYLEAGRGVSPLRSGWLASGVLAGGAVGALLGGYLSDAALRLTGDRRWSRRAIGFSGMALSSLALGLALRCHSAELATLFTALASFLVQLQIAPWWTVVTEVSGRHVGALFGLLNSLGVPGGAASQYFVGWFADRQKDLGYSGRAQWDPIFYVYMVVLLVGAVGWLFIDPTHSAVECAGDSAAEPNG